MTAVHPCNCAICDDVWTALCAAPWYLEKIEIVLLNATSPIKWEAHFRGWIGMEMDDGKGESSDPELPPQPPSVELSPDPLAWEEWDMQVSDISRNKCCLKSQVLPDSPPDGSFISTPSGRSFRQVGHCVLQPQPT